MFRDLSSKIERFYELTELGKKELFDEIHRRASADKVRFTNYMRDLEFGFDQDRAIFYETIWSNSEGFEDWIFDEQIKLIEAAEAGDDGAISDMGSLMYLTQIKTNEKDFYRKSVDFILSKLNSPVSEVREYCMEGIFDLVDMENRNLTNQEIKALRKLLKDSSFKIRIYAYCNLKEEKLLPNGFQLSFFDKTRARFTGYGEMIK